MGFMSTLSRSELSHTFIEKSQSRKSDEHTKYLTAIIHPFQKQSKYFMIT
jgi:hypothetical protein